MCLKRQKNEKEARVGPFLKKDGISMILAF